MSYKLPVSSGDRWDLAYLIEREIVSPFVASIGMQASIDGVGSARTWIEIHESLYQAEGLVHGGVIYTLADAAVAIAVHSCTRPTQKIATIEAKMNYLAPATTGTLSAFARVEHEGQTLAVAQCEITNETPERTRRVALMLCTFALLADRGA
ncbi:MAG: PaaI family thioesterase [Chloroflexota bacterium]